MPAHRMSGGGATRGRDMRHVGAAALALALSLLIHATLLARLPAVTLASVFQHHEPRQYVRLELADVQLQPPAPASMPERELLDRPSVDVPDRFATGELMSELSDPPDPLRLPLPQPPEPPPPMSSVDRMEAVASTPVRQEVLAIQEQLFAEDISALPRRWVEKNIPRIDQAPDIQLPVEAPAVADPLSVPRPVTPVYLEDMTEGTPEWLGAMTSASRQGSGVDIAALRPLIPTRQTASDFDERPEDVSRLQPIEDLLQVKAVGYASPADGYLYFTLWIERASDRLLTVLPRDVLLIQDSSESMTPEKIDEFRRGLKRWMDFMNPGDRFDVLGFRDDTYACFGAWREYDEQSRREAFGFIDRIRASGNTDVYRSLQSALSVSQDPERTMLVVLMTDGRPTVGVTGSSDIIEGTTRFNQGRVSIFSVGGGKKANSFFLDLLSYRNRGEAIVVRGDEEIPRAMETWARQLQRPVLTDLTYRFSGIDASEVYPRQLTHLFLDRPLKIHGRVPLDAQQIVLQVVGRSGEQWHDMVFTIAREHLAEGQAELKNQWAWQKMYHLIGEYLGQPDPATLESVRSFADEYQLIVPYGFSRALPARAR